ncbi:hypothetical protein H4R18_001743 [Coemansia javaensis]|uniref:FAD-binding FR-type domain-containing protein n=1 Tax=Coemansia javaensis TaxID=2761396 RepID=A0A9W8HGC0_9FUNG|nr:hypothetical protein H4R18_001743 [Coemansia javaensis]
MVTFAAQAAAAGPPRTGSSAQSGRGVSRKSSMLLRNRAFDGYRLTDRRAASERPWWRRIEGPEITVRRAAFVGVWVAIQVTVMIRWWVAVGRTQGSLSGFARATACCINVCVAAIFLFMSPTLLELLRRTPLSRHVVFEKNIHAHKVAAYTLVFWGVAHVAAYYYKFHKATLAPKGAKTFGYMLFKTKPGSTGHALLFLFFAIFVTSMPVVRRRMHELFYWMHHLFVPCVVLIFVHGSAASFQWYFVGPGAIYVLDRLYRFVRSRSKRPRILSVIQHPSNVIELKIERRGMQFQVGQYIYLNVPSISPLEWHPFTLTSAPEEDVISVHIWIAGGWTRKLVRLFQDSAVTLLYPDSDAPPPHADCEKPGMGTLKALADAELAKAGGDLLPLPPPPPGGAAAAAAAAAHGQDGAHGRRPSTSAGRQPWARPGRNSTVLLDRLPPAVEFRKSSGSFVVASTAAPRVADTQPSIKLPTIMVDGPYGAPTQQVFDYEHVVLVAGGIGVTPMSSVLKSLYYQLTEQARPCRIRKVYFLWVCRDVQALEWFQDLLAALDMEDIGDILEVRTYLTGQLSVEQIRNIALYQDPTGPDAVTGLYRSPTYYGRPNFGTIFEDIGMRTPNVDVGVFACGPRGMTRSLRRVSRKWTSSFSNTTKTRFVFHQEKF